MFNFAHEHMAAGEQVSETQQNRYGLFQVWRVCNTHIHTQSYTWSVKTFEHIKIKWRSVHVQVVRCMCVCVYDCMF